jgi:hypothetical protein
LIMAIAIINADRALSVFAAEVNFPTFGKEGPLYFSRDTGKIYRWDYSGAAYVEIGGGGGVTDHGLLTGLADDDHPQYALDTDLSAHMTDAVDAHAASAITNTPAGNIAAATVQAAINELDTEKLSITQARERLNANRTYYVATTGLDSNDGLSAGSPFLTVQKAIDATAAIDISIYNVDIQLVDGTYGAGCVVTGPWVGSGTVTVKGNATTPANVLLSTGAADSIMARTGGRLTVESLKLTNTGNFLLIATTAGSITFSNLDFGSVGAQQIRADDGGIVLAAGNYTISGGGVNHHNSSGGTVRVQERTITLVGTPAFSEFAKAEFPGLIIVNGNTYSGAATGVRYYARLNGAIVTRGGGATYLPGDGAGTVVAGGQYD